VRLARAPRKHGCLGSTRSVRAERWRTRRFRKLIARLPRLDPLSACGKLDCSGAFAAPLVRAPNRGNAAPFGADQPPHLTASPLERAVHPPPLAAICPANGGKHAPIDPTCRQIERINRPQTRQLPPNRAVDPRSSRQIVAFFADDPPRTRQLAAIRAVQPPCRALPARRKEAMAARTRTASRSERGASAPPAPSRAGHPRSSRQLAVPKRVFHVLARAADELRATASP